MRGEAYVASASDRPEPSSVETTRIVAELRGDLAMMPSGERQFWAAKLAPLLDALSSQSLSLPEARAENDRKDAEIERLKGLVAGIRECPQEPVGWTFEFLGHDGEWGRAFAFFDQGEPANGTGAIVRNVVLVRRAA